VQLQVTGKCVHCTYCILDGWVVEYFLNLQHRAYKETKAVNFT